MGVKSSIARHRKNRHAHALERLRERHFADADVSEVLALRDLAKVAHIEGKSFAHGTTDGRWVRVPLRDKMISVVYTPRHDAIATVLP